MSKDYELVKELKNGDKKKTSFFKEKIKDELKINGIDTNESTINDIFNKALDTYNENIKIPFLFHIKAIIKNKNKIIETSEEEKSLKYKVIKLYLSKENDKYLSKIEIANKLSIKIDEVIYIIESLNDNDLSKVFPNYKEMLKDRNDYFNNKGIIISEKEIILLVEYCGGLENEMDFKDIALKYNKTIFDIKKSRNISYFLSFYFY